MDPEQARQELEATRADPDFVAASSALSDAWSAKGAGVELVEPILRFMEANPDLEYGTPGGLVHFVERFPRRGYEQDLLTSISRHPTWVTTWMLNRLINGTEDESARFQLVRAMREVLAHPLVDQATVDQVRGFLELHAE